LESTQNQLRFLRLKFWPLLENHATHKNRKTKNIYFARARQLHIFV
jgi:hypothetical protein